MPAIKLKLVDSLLDGDHILDGYHKYTGVGFLAILFCTFYPIDGP